ncbi:hypothetical protein V8E55_002380 [Tylopilus felleus]
MFPTVAHVRSHRDSHSLLHGSRIPCLVFEVPGSPVYPECRGYPLHLTYCYSFARFRYFFWSLLYLVSVSVSCFVSWLVAYLHQFQYCFPFGFGIGISIVSVRKFTTKLSDDPCGLNIPSTTYAHSFKQTTLQTSSP